MVRFADFVRFGYFVDSRGLDFVDFAFYFAVLYFAVGFALALFATPYFAFLALRVFFASLAFGFLFRCHLSCFGQVLCFLAGQMQMSQEINKREVWLISFCVLFVV